MRGLDLPSLVTLAVLAVFGLAGMWKGLLPAKLPGLRRLDRFLGLLFGLLKGVLILWVALAILSFFEKTAVVSQILPVMEASPVLWYFYRHNLLILGLGMIYEVVVRRSAG